MYIAFVDINFLKRQQFEMIVSSTFSGAASKNNILSYYSAKTNLTEKNKIGS